MALGDFSGADIGSNPTERLHLVTSGPPLGVDRMAARHAIAAARAKMAAYDAPGSIKADREECGSHATFASNERLQHKR